MFINTMTLAKMQKLPMHILTSEALNACWIVSSFSRPLSRRKFSCSTAPVSSSVHTTQTNSDQKNSKSDQAILYNNQINARALIGQSAMLSCAGKLMEKSRVFSINRELKVIPQYCIAHLYCARFLRHQRAHMSACSCKTWRICLDIELCQLKNGCSAPTSMGTPTFFRVIVINLSQTLFEERLV